MAGHTHILDCVISRFWLTCRNVWNMYVIHESEGEKQHSARHGNIAALCVGAGFFWTTNLMNYPHEICQWSTKNASIFFADVDVAVITQANCMSLLPDRWCVNDLFRPGSRIDLSSFKLWPALPRGTVNPITFMDRFIHLQPRHTHSVSPPLSLFLSSVCVCRSPSPSSTLCTVRTAGAE